MDNYGKCETPTFLADGCENVLTESFRLPCKGSPVVPVLVYPMDSSQPGCSVHGIFQARILEWVAISYSKIDT